jgi:hypothetical protein
MSKLIGFACLAVLAGTSVVAWSRSTTHEPRTVQVSTISPHEMHLKIDANALPVFKLDDRSMELTAP